MVQDYVKVVLQNLIIKNECFIISMSLYYNTELPIFFLYMINCLNIASIMQPF